ncbi:epidermal growth factor receptor substrate 15 [Entomortierella parvispora]|uniref:Epidermal growth factor receptor substrate 15 n=1 Tax=Entomortierella parvispora TaxID=205924 RepID=A0A9P3LVS1_9FUNG|nr:epidermal growth factor receptor substrate 15 [Entomortierella parvispora]
MASFGSPISRDGTGTVRRRVDIILSAREKQVYGQLWAAADKDNSGFITGADAVPFLAKSGLSPQVLGQIWLLADSEDKGVLGQQGFSIAVKLIAHVQNGKTPSLSLINTDAPLPRFEGLTGPAQTDSPVISSAAPVTAHLTGSEPAVTNEDRTKYGGMFMACGPNNGLLDGDKAREVFLKSKLPVDKLSQIWSLADTKQRGSLDITDFTIAMYYIQHTMDGSIKSLPLTLPPSILKACAGPGSASTLMASPVMSSQPIPRQSTGNNMGIHNPMVVRQMTGSVSMTSSPLAKQNTGGANIFGASSLSTEAPWDISADEKAKFDRFFDKLDTDRDGLIGGEEAGQFFMNSRLPASVLAQIWDLSDITGTGSLSRDEFAVAMFLINRKNATGAAIPKTLPATLVPPSLRSRVSSNLSFASEPIRSSTMPSVAGAQQFRRQSFDLLGDGPSLTTSLSSTGVSHDHKDLMGAEDLTSKITSETGELASMQNQINNLGKVTGDLQAKRAILETNLSMLSAQKQDISIRLNQIKTLHENERKSITDLENALSTIQPQLVKLREELVVSERELAVARASRDEYLLSLNKDQDENNMIKTRLRQNNEETVKLREELEAKKKDTGRQKSLLEIARRQLATSDADKQKLIKEIENESEKAAQAAHDIQNLSSSSPAPSSPAPAHSSVAPPPPAPRGSRKEPPPPPASRGTAASTMSSFARSPEAEAEEAFGIPPALRSPTGSFHSVNSQRNAQTIISRQSTGSSPFEPISRQGTGSSPFEPIPRQGTGMSANTPSTQNVGGEANQNNNGFLSTPDAGAQDLWSPSTHAAHATLAGQAEVTKSPEPETPPTPLGAATLALAASQALPTSPPISQDPFAAMAFPSMDTPPVTKMDFDSAFTGFAAKPTSSNSNVQGANSTGDGVRSAEAFAQEFPDIENAAGEDDDARKAKRVSAFGFDDDFSAPGNSPFHSRKDEDSEFPPIVEVAPVDEDTTDESDNEDAFVQAKSSIASPEPTAETTVTASIAPVVSAPVAASSEDENIFGSSATSTETPPVAAPVPTAPVSKKLTAADFGEFENSFGGSTGEDDFDSAFKGVELSTAPKVTATSRSMAGFDDGFDFNTSSFDDAFGGPSPFGSTAAVGAPTSSSSSAPAPTFGASFSAPFHQDSFGDMEFNTPAASHVAAPSSTAAAAVDLDEAFGGFGSGTQQNAGTATTTNAFGDDNGFGEFEAQFSSQPPVSSSAVAPQASPRPVPAAPVTTAAPATTTTSGVETTSTAPVPPKVDLPGVDELINMGFSRQQANDALSRYDTVERAANFLLEGGL